MEIKDFEVKEYGKVLSRLLAEFIEKHHYKKSARSLKQRKVFGLYHASNLIGVAVYGQPCGISVQKVHGKSTLELRRFCIVDEAPKNSESFFLGATLRALRFTRFKKVISFADPNKQHEGTIYKASNWTYEGVEKYRQQILRFKGKDIHMRQVYQKSKKTGQYTKSALTYQSWRKLGAKAILTKPKHIFTYKIRK